MSPIIPHPNTPQLKVIDAYLTSLATFDLARLQSLTTDDFHMVTAPASVDVPDKTKKEDIAFLEKLKENLGGQHLKVSGDPVISLSCKTLLCSTVYRIRCRRWVGD